MKLNHTALAINEFTRKLHFGLNVSEDATAGVRIEKDKSIATNGHIMLVVDNLTEEDNHKNSKLNDETILIDSEAINTVKKLLGKDKTLRLKENETHIIAKGKDKSNRNFSYEIEKSSNRYPDYGAIFPKTEPVVEISFTAELLIKVLNFVKKHGEDDGPGHPIKFSIYGKGQPMKFDVSTMTGQKITGLIMSHVED